MTRIMEDEKYLFLERVRNWFVSEKYVARLVTHVLSCILTSIAREERHAQSTALILSVTPANVD